MRNKKIEIFHFFRTLKYFTPIIIALVLAESIIWRTTNLSGYKNLFIWISWILNILLMMVFTYAVLRKAKEFPVREEYRGRCVYLVYTFILLLVTFLGLASLYGAILSQDEYGAIAFIPAVLFLGIGALGWFDNFTTRIVVTEDGIAIKRSRLLPFPGLSYDFDDIEKIKARGPFVKIKCEDLVSPAGMFISNPRKFIEILKKYAPDRFDIK